MGKGRDIIWKAKYFEFYKFHFHIYRRTPVLLHLVNTVTNLMDYEEINIAYFTIAKIILDLIISQHYINSNLGNIGYQGRALRQRGAIISTMSFNI